MNFTSLKTRCPKCGSWNVVYSCEPDCCFNHVCEDCLGSFQLATRDLGRSITGLIEEGPATESCTPTARCARCQSLGVRSAAASDETRAAAVCVACEAVLELVYEQ